MFDGKRSQVNVFEAADIDSRHALARRVGPFAIVVDAAGRAETMPDGVLVEQIRAGIFVRRQASGVSRRSVSRGTNQRSDPLREQMVQLHASTLVGSPSTSNAIRPQWQLPLCVMA